MIRWTLIVAVALIAWWGNGFSEAMAQAQGTASATVISIGDGDTIRVQQDGRKITVRLAYIDAPEMAQRPYGTEARTYLQQRLPVGHQVRLDVKTTDRYGRTVAEVITDSNIGLAMVEDGQAFAYRQYLDQCNKREYLEAEDRASRRRLGVWQVPGASPSPGTSGALGGQANHPEETLPDPLQAAAGTPAARSAPMPEPRNFCARGTPTSMGTGMVRPARACGDSPGDPLQAMTKRCQ